MSAIDRQKRRIWREITPKWAPAQKDGAGPFPDYMRAIGCEQELVYIVNFYKIM